MSSKIYHESDGDLSILKGKRIGVIGYGNQGRSQALNMRDLGISVIIGNREDNYKKRAEQDKFDTYSIIETVKLADYLFFLIPDEIMKEVFEKQIRPNLKTNQVLVFASGYNIAFNLIQPPQDIDVLLIAPRMIGIGVRERFLNKKGFFSFIGIHQDASGEAKERLLALAKGIGALSKAGVEVTFKQEAVLDLFTEQAYGPGFGQVLMGSVNTLVEAGYPAEAVFIELIYSGEMSYTFDKMTEFGLINQMNFHSQTSQYGSTTRAIKFRKVSKDIRQLQREVLNDIEIGEFAKEWERKLSKVKLKLLRFLRSKIRFAKTEKEVRKNLNLPISEQFSEINFPEKEMGQHEEIDKEIKAFKDFYKDF